MSVHGTPRRGNGITEIVENSVRRALPRQRGYDINGLVPDLKSEIPPKETADPESAVFMTTDLRKEAETSLFSTSPFPSWVGLGNDFRHISVIALPRLGLPRGVTRDTLPTLATHGRPGETRRGALLNPYGQGVGESIHLPGVTP